MKPSSQADLGQTGARQGTTGDKQGPALLDECVKLVRTPKVLLESRCAWVLRARDGSRETVHETATTPCPPRTL